MRDKNVFRNMIIFKINIFSWSKEKIIRFNKLYSFLFNSVHVNCNLSEISQPFFQLMCRQSPFAPLVISIDLQQLNCCWAICGVDVTVFCPQTKAARNW